VTIKDADMVPMATNVCDHHHHEGNMERFNKYLAKYGLRNDEAISAYSDTTGEYSYISFALEIATTGAATAVAAAAAAREEE
jgi:thiaminase